MWWGVGVDESKGRFSPPQKTYSKKYTRRCLTPAAVPPVVAGGGRDAAAAAAEAAPLGPRMGTRSFLRCNR